MRCQIFLHLFCPLVSSEKSFQYTLKMCSIHHQHDYISLFPGSYLLISSGSMLAILSYHVLCSNFLIYTIYTTFKTTICTFSLLTTSKNLVHIFFTTTWQTVLIPNSKHDLINNEHQSVLEKIAQHLPRISASKAIRTYIPFSA